MNKAKAVYLFFAGLTLIAIGGYIGFTPTAYLEQLHLNQATNQEVLSEMRGMGGSLFVFGLFIFGACFQRKMAESALIISTLVFTSFALFRLLGIVIDGMPSQGILLALSIEVLLAALGVIVRFKSKLVTK